MSNNLYETLWVNKTATQAEIKKAYRKQAMKYHPDKNKGNKTAEKKFKEVNEAYQTLSDTSKRKQYDTFWSAKWNPFAGWWWTGGNPFSGVWGTSWGNPFAGQWGGQWGFSGFEDLFWGQSGWAQNVEFDFEDLFGNAGWGGNPFGQQQQTQQKPKKPVSLDFEKTYEVPVFDMILGCKIGVKWVYGQTAKLKIPPSTKSGTKFRVKDFGKSEGSKKWNLIVKIVEIMPKHISATDKKLLEQIRDSVGY